MLQDKTTKKTQVTSNKIKGKVHLKELHKPMKEKDYFLSIQLKINLSSIKIPSFPQTKRRIGGKQCME